MKRPHSDHFRVRMWLGGGGQPTCQPKFMVFLDSQILSGTYFYHLHLVNCIILHLITILSTGFFAMSPYKLKTENSDKYGFQWPILDPFCPLIQQIIVIFEIICYFLLSYIFSNKIKPNSYESPKIDLSYIVTLQPPLCEALRAAVGHHSKFVTLF